MKNIKIYYGTKQMTFTPLVGYDRISNRLIFHILFFGVTIDFNNSKNTNEEDSKLR